MYRGPRSNFEEHYTTFDVYGIFAEIVSVQSQAKAVVHHVLWGRCLAAATNVEANLPPATRISVRIRTQEKANICHGTQRNTRLGIADEWRALHSNQFGENS